MPSPIRHVVILFKENHAFDNYFGTFPGAEGITMPRSPNPPTKDPDHRHAAWLSRKTTAARMQFVEQDIPAYFACARQFTLCDHYFTDVAGPSTPNHLMVIAADSPIIDNPPSQNPPLYDLPSLPAALDQARLTWANYGGYAFDYIKALQGRNHYISDQFVQDASSGKLAAVSWVYAPHDASEHPPDPPDKNNPLVGNVTHGMQWTVNQVNAIVKGGLWPTTAIFVTWDDWGGWFDHVDPPELEKWKDGTQFRYGSRVGCLVLSPYAKAGYVSKLVHSHVSLLKFCLSTFGLAAWNSRVAAVDDMGDCFDFTQVPLAPPPPNPTSTTIHKKEKRVAKKKVSNSRFHPSVKPPFRVVPLHVPEIAGAPAKAAAPHLSYRNGPLIANVQVFTIFWGTGWKQSPASGSVAPINKFFGDILKSPLLDQLGEYSVAGFPIGHGSFAGTANVTTPDPKSSVDDSAIQSMIQNQIANHSGVVQPGPNVLYFVFLPPGVQVVQGGSASCQAFCGYHDSISGKIFYAVMPYPNCQGCTGGLDAFAALTSTSSHELCEAITDPVPGEGWYDDQNGEIGDICAWKTKTVAGYTVQLEWSN